MQFQILGPLEVRRQGSPVAVGAAKQRALLAILLVHANELVSSDRLIDELWPQPPETAANTLQVYVGKLRKALEPGRTRGAPAEVLITRAPGYMLRVEAGQLDAERFESLLADGSRAREAGESPAAAELLRDALELWRGDALADFSYEPFAQAEIARLEELRLSALEERIEADLALGRHAALVGELEGLVREHPLRERLRAQLMLALYRAGRQADALEVYRDGRSWLAEELGIDPAPELQRLEGAILRQEAELEPPGEVAAEPTAPAEVATPSPETRKTVTVLVAARPAREGVDPEALRTLDEGYLDAARRAIERHGGSVESVLGDRVMAVFGIPRVHEDDALRAARAAMELPGGQAGLATGEVVTGESGSAGSSLAGEPLARAGELADAAPAEGILLADATHMLLGEAARVEPAADGVQPAWRLLEVVPRPPPLSRPPEIPLVGRDGELAQLAGAFERTAHDPTVHLFTILGAAGIGKTRLAEEFAATVAGEATVLAGRCVPYGEGITFWPLREIVERLTAAQPLARLLAGEEDAELVAARLTEAIGRTEASSSVEEIFWAFRRLLETISRDRPVVVVFEDVHWAEPTLLDLIEYVAERVRGAPILLLCLARLELLEGRPGWGGGKRSARSLFLERLSEAESEQLIDTLAASLPAATRAQVQETAEGNPLFLEQILAMLAEGQTPEGEVPIPPTIQAVLAARLDRLGPGERAVIERAAVVGKEFPEAAVAELVPDDACAFTSRHMEALVGKELLNPVHSPRPDQESFRFRHVLIQQATYRAIPKRLRARLHERVADWLERSVGEGTAEYAETAGYHLEQTYRYRAELGPVGDEDRELARRAAELLASAGRRAFGRGDMPAAVNLLERSRSLLPTDDRARLELLPDLGFAMFEVGQLDRADSVLTEAIERGRAGGNQAVEWNATVKRAHARMYTDPEGMDPARLLHDATAAADVLGQLGDDLGLARAWSLVCEAHWPGGRMDEAAKAAHRAAEHARRAGSRRDESWGFGAHAFALLHGPVPAAEAADRTQQLLREAQGNLVLEANLAGFLAAHEAMGGRFEDAREHIAESCERLNDLGLKWQVGVQELLSGHIELFARDPSAAERHMRAARDSFIAIGDRWFLATVSVDLPRPVFELGRYEEAASLVDAIDDVPVSADREWQLKRRCMRARLLAREGRTETAEDLAREGVAIAAETDQLWFHADALIDLAEVLRMAGRPEDAAGAAEQALRLFERKGIVPSAARARALVEQLRGEAPVVSRVDPTR
jgi:DNA-binding SARP family transcriptional activator